ncbi:MAG: NADP-dependent malic enzyme [Candidatus Nanohaloarchaea archaeon]|nr:NADP-dependent malic enzyme [Candidatus Nanohaloarchaea archaeon]
MDPLEYHRKHQGKLRVEGTVSIDSLEDLGLAYTPGVAEPARAIADDAEKSYEYTAKGKMVGVVSNGSAVLGLGDIGAAAAAPVMEGKALLIHELAGVSAFPLLIDEQDPDAFIEAAARLHPGFGFFLLEDIASPDCFRIEDALKERLDIPVFHDDQHGAAVAVLAGVKNALDVVGKDMTEVSIALVGAGAAGTAATKLLMEAGVEDITVVDRSGILAPGMDLLPHHRELADLTNPDGQQGDLADAMQDADVFIGLSTSGIVSQEMVRSMAEDPVVFAMANPDPEIPYPDARDAGAAVVGTGRSDFPNQINNSLAFPGIVRGALTCRAREVNTEMQLAAADAIAAQVDEPSPDQVVPSSLDPDLHDAVADAVRNRGGETGACRV